MELAKKHSIAKQHIYDTQFVATMIENEVKKILTVNTSDFSFFGCENYPHSKGLKHTSSLPACISGHNYDKFVIFHRTTIKEIPSERKGLLEKGSY